MKRLAKILALLSVGLGYAVGSQWQVVSQAVTSYSVWLVGAAVVGAGAYLVVRRLRQNSQAQMALQPVSVRVSENL